MNPQAGKSQEEVNQLISDALEHGWVHMMPWNAVSAPDGLKVFERAAGSKIYDIKGREYIDGLSGAWVSNVGHGRKEIIDAMAKQAEEIAYASPFVFLSPSAIQLAKKLAEISPEPLTRAFIASGGAEVVDTAVAMARQYFFNTGEPTRYKVITRRDSYHGSTYGGKSLSGLKHAAHDGRAGPLLPGIHQVSPPNCYRCDFGLKYPDCGIMCAREIENVIKQEGADTVAAVFGEPISVAGETAIPVPEYWPMIREICDKYGVLLIFDEVLIGMGRTGKWFGCEHFDVAPDMLTTAKGIASGYTPISALLVSDKVADAFKGDGSVVFPHGYTYGNHPVACAAGVANIGIIERDNLVERSAEMGEYMLEKMQSLYSHPIVGDIRGKGLLGVVDITKDRETRSRFAPGDNIGGRLHNYLMDEGVILRVWQVIMVAPPFTVSHEEIDKIIDAIDRALSRFEKEMGIE
jgi:adenosylmethionine-8-amino-7-oxononanoate aminotransferase